MKKLLIGIFVFPWIFAHHSELASISMFCFILIINFVISLYPVYLLSKLTFEREFLIVLASIISSVFLTWLYSKIADSLIWGD